MECFKILKKMMEFNSDLTVQRELQLLDQNQEVLKRNQPKKRLKNLLNNNNYNNKLIINQKLSKEFKKLLKILQLKIVNNPN